jgi:hypothetical protein
LEALTPAPKLFSITQQEEKRGTKLKIEIDNATEYITDSFELVSARNYCDKLFGLVNAKELRLYN